MSTPQKSPGDIVREELERGDRLALISDRVQDVLFDTSAWHKITETHVRRLEAHTQDRTFVSTATEINQDQDQRAPGTRSEATREHTDETTTVSSDTAGAAKVTPEAVETPTTTSVVDGDIQQGPPATTSASRVLKREQVKNMPELLANASLEEIQRIIDWVTLVYESDGEDGVEDD